MDENIIKQRAKDTIVVPLSSLLPNTYNPNRMGSTEMGLLCQAIKKYGFLFPIITTWDEDK